MAGVSPNHILPISLRRMLWPLGFAVRSVHVFHRAPRDNTSSETALNTDQATHVPSRPLPSPQNNNKAGTDFPWETATKTRGSRHTELIESSM